MNKFIADIFSLILTVLHVIVAIALIFVVTTSASTQVTVGAVIIFVLYVVIIGFISVVLTMNENIANILKILEKNTIQSKQSTENIVGNVVDRNTRLEPKI